MAEFKLPGQKFLDMAREEFFAANEEMMALALESVKLMSSRDQGAIRAFQAKAEAAKRRSDDASERMKQETARYNAAVEAAMKSFG